MNELDQIPAEITAVEFYQLNCSDCTEEPNIDQDPSCFILAQVLAARKANNLQCEKYKQKRWQK